MNYLSECQEDFRSLKLGPDEFQAQVCPRCRNGKCDLSRWQHDPFSQRIATQPERFFHPQQADAHSSRYAHLVDFGDLLHRAMQLEVADRRKDWAVPEIPVLDGRIEPASQPVCRQPVLDPEPEEEPGAVDVPLPEPEPEPERALPPVTRPQKVPDRMPQVGNVPMPEQGLMVGGGPSLPAAPPVDPWAPPPPKPKIVQPGARIRFGLTGEIDEPKPK